MNKNLVVTYTNGDDGVWIQCLECGDLLETLGFWPTVNLIQERASLYEDSHNH